jgi:threonine dehydratase
MTAPFVTLAEIEAARWRIVDRVLRTPIERSVSLSERAGVPVFLKLEHRQTTGAFKLRGAANAVALLKPEERKRGVITVSTGNHGRALAFAAKAAGLRAVICMSSLVPQNKVAEIRRLGAEVRITGKSQDEAEIEVRRLIETEGLVPIPPFDHPAVIAGQGTIGLEIAADVPDVGTVLVPVSGGGLAAGVAAAVKALRPAARVIGVSMTRGAAMKASFDAGRPVQVEELPTLADSLGGGIGLENRWTFPMLRALLDDLILVDEAEITAAITHAYAVEREVIEGAAAVGIAAVLSGRVALEGPTVLVLSGKNIDMGLHRKVITGQPGNFGEAAA